MEDSEQKKTKFYTFYINNHMKNKQYSNLKTNYISTTKYNIITFLPKSLLLQFTRLPNVYFLFIAILQSIPAISPLTSVTAILPLVFVLCVSMIRELIEDIGRYKYDKANNNRKVVIFKNNQFIEDISENIQVGDIVLVNENEEFPCDLILLDSSNSDGICFIETGSLDGEKNLKNKIANIDLKGNFYHKGVLTQNFLNIEGKIKCDFPNPELYKFDGKMSLIWNGSPNDEIEKLNYVLTASQLLLKGALLRQTNQIAGIVVYSGSNNKILLNSKNPKMKLSNIERLMNTLLVFVFFLQLILCLICAIYHRKYEKNNYDFLDIYIFSNSKVKKESFLSFFTYLLLLNTMIPISLIVTLEIIKVFQGLFISFDIELFSFVRQKFCGPNSVSIIEELGKINYIFSDKTGTLTCNKMQFKYCVIGNLCFEYVRDEQIILNNNYVNINMSNNKKYDSLNSKSRGLSKNFDDNNLNQYAYDMNNNQINNYNNMHIPSNPPPQYTNNINNNNNSQLTDKSRGALLSAAAPTTLFEGEKFPSKKELNKIIKINSNYMYDIVSRKNSQYSSNEIEMINTFWMALAIGNECIPSFNEQTGILEYNGMSPDDIELVKASSEQGYTMLKSPNDIKRIKYGNNEKSVDYKILNIISFTSDRKRMSIIIRDPKNNIIMYSKGADSEIKKRLNPNGKKSHLDYAVKFTDYFSSKGYRTLFIGYKKLSENDYSNFAKKLKDAELNLENKETLVNHCYNEMEQNLTLLGVTIVEDKLQDQVPETIKDLRNAGIKIWMLTGDKLDTAENISLSCNLISKENKNYRISASSDLKEDILSFFTDFGKTNGIEININNNNEEEKEEFFNESNIKPFSLIIESAVLGYIFNDKIITRNFLKIALCAVSVVCCRVSPLQKSQVVKEVKNINKNFITLAIGDGGNDVSMIMEAHVGIGIYGEEGMLAVQSSDFSIGEFKFLRRLLFFHGRNSLNRTGNMILYFFFKNFTFTIIQFYFTFYNIASGQSIIDDWFISCYNLIFTALPLGVQALTNFDVLSSDYEFADQLMPLLYYESNYNCVFSVSSFCWSLFKAIFYSAINFFVVIYSSKESSIGNLGQYSDIWFNSLCLYTNIIFVVSFSLMIKQMYWVWLFPFIIILTSWIIFFLFCIIAQSQSMFNSSGAIYPSFQSGKFWFNVIIVTGFCFIFDYLLHSFEINFSGKLCNELLNNLENKYNLTTIFERSEVIKKAYIKMDLAGKPSKNRNESFSSQSENNNRSYSSNKSNSKKNDKNASFSSSKEQMIPAQNDLKELNQNNEYGVQASRIMEKKNKLKKNEMLRNTSGNSKTKKLEDTDLDIPNNKFLTSYNQKDNDQENINNIIKVKKHKKNA